MAEEHPNVRTVREGFEALDRGDMNWMTEHMADDIVWHVGGKSKVAGEHRGKEAVMDLFARQSQMLGSAKIDLAHSRYMGHTDTAQDTVRRQLRGHLRRLRLQLSAR